MSSSSTWTIRPSAPITSKSAPPHPHPAVYASRHQQITSITSHPILPLANAGNFSYPDPDWAVYNFGTNSSVRLVVYNEFAAFHPMHLHGHNFNVLAEGFGTWDGVISHQNNTQRRDTQLIQGGSPTNPAYIVLQYNTDNPGTWPFHCHIAWHASSGLYINTIEQTTQLQQRVLPPVVNSICQAWDAYSASNVVDEIDSGEKRKFARDFSLPWMRDSAESEGNMWYWEAGACNAFLGGQIGPLVILLGFEMRNSGGLGAAWVVLRITFRHRHFNLYLASIC